MQEKWIYLEIPEAEKRYYLNKLTYNHNGLKIIMDNGEKNGKLIQIYFQAIESYRYCDEHDRINLLQKLNKVYEKVLYANFNLFKVENSNYIKWLNKSSCGITEEFVLLHYIIMDSDCIIDIISYGEPEFKSIIQK